MITRSTTAIALGLALGMPATAFAGMGKVFPTYHPAPCSGDDCRADDPRSNEDCAGLLCTCSSAKAMRPPMTGAQAAEAERAKTAVAAASPEPVAPAAVAAKRKAKRVTKAKAVLVTRPAAAVAPAPAAEAVR